jgi:hypothetical protein
MKIQVSNTGKKSKKLIIVIVITYVLNIYCQIKKRRNENTYTEKKTTHKVYNEHIILLLLLLLLCITHKYLFVYLTKTENENERKRE